MKNPTVSIGLPVYNGEKYLEKAIDSILGQDFPDYELIISDNASEDRTEEICRRYAEKDSRIRYVRNDVNIGAAKNYNNVFHMARGEFFKWMAHDDVCHPGLLSECLKVFDSEPRSVVLVYAQSQFIDADGVFLSPDLDVLETRHGKAYRRLAYILQAMNMASAIFGLIRAETLRKTRLIDSFIGSDYVLFAELAMLGEFTEVKKVLYSRRMHDDSSRAGNRSNKEVQAWFDPSRKLRFVVAHRFFPETSARVRWVYEWMRSVCRIPLSRTERLSCFVTVPVAYGFGRFRCYGGIWKRRVRRLGNWLLKLVTKEKEIAQRSGPDLGETR